VKITNREYEKFYRIVFCAWLRRPCHRVIGLYQKGHCSAAGKVARKATAVPYIPMLGLLPRTTNVRSPAWRMRRVQADWD
jgi:hypothetical protein